MVVPDFHDASQMPKVVGVPVVSLEYRLLAHATSHQSARLYPCCARLT